MRKFECRGLATFSDKMTVRVEYDIEAEDAFAAQREVRERMLSISDQGMEKIERLDIEITDTKQYQF